MIKFIQKNKLVSALLGFAVFWAIWVTDGIYNGRETKAVAGEVTKQISKDIEFLKADVKIIKEELKEQNKKAQEEKDKWFEILLDIKKATKNDKPQGNKK